MKSGRLRWVVAGLDPILVSFSRVILYRENQNKPLTHHQLITGQYLRGVA